MLAESYERIHRSNLIGMGVAPLQFQPGESARDPRARRHASASTSSASTALNDGALPKTVTVARDAPTTARTEFEALLRIDTPTEAEYYRHGGVLHYVLRAAGGGRRTR